ncbi:MAG: RNA polymerase factor sigma-54 [Spirochaetes bacterium]|nr:RNA polymerase factor sigma-54 [Spirochaetota bacterium]
MPVVELTELIQTELETNPALEVLEDSTEESLDTYAEDKTDKASDAWDNENADFSYGTPGGDEDLKRKFIEGAISLPETLQEHLLAQFHLLFTSPELREVGEKLIQNLDEDGFHIISPVELCPECGEKELKIALSLVQALDPQGACTKDYKESLLVQTSLYPEAPKGAVEILMYHFEALEKGKYAEIRKALGLKEAQFEKILEFIKTLSPFPGRLYSTEKTRYVVPDLAMRIEDNELVIELNGEIIPTLGINPFFSELSARKGSDKEASGFAKMNMEKAKFFISSIHQRNATLVKVARAIAKFQMPFFLDGPMAMQPLTLKDVAEEVGVHETTVSRIANGKYVQTEWGIFELRRFFTNAVAATISSAAQHSKESVKATLSEILESDQGEGHALSDREIVDILRRRGIQIARRTVAKYRGELDLDSSFSRHRH